ncbi:MAG: GGDEF domain-containing protein, partial [Solirubrobacterales bacterium]|nr:GGDEF domain-containing protein [Solirubrobacterales bacterium]
GPDSWSVSPSRLIGVCAALVSIATFTSILVHAEFLYRRASVLDPLTGLLNRSGLPARFHELTEQAALSGAAVGVIALDLDRFKAINDNHGHPVGDAVLKHAAYALSKSLRSFGLIYQMGGEEFLVLLPGADLAKSIEVAELLRGRLERLEPAGVHLTASLGVSAGRGAVLDLRALYDAADAALYEAKRAGRNRVMAAGDPPTRALAAA